MRSRLPPLLRTSALGALLVVAPPVAVAFEFDTYGPPGPPGYGEFYQSDQSSASDPSCSSCVDGGVASEFSGTDLAAARSAWEASILTRHGVTPGSFFGEDFDGSGWQHDMVFDSQEPPDSPPAPTIADSVTISNDLPGDSLRAEEPAKADRTPGSSPAIDRLAWEARDEFDPDNGDEPEATIDFGNNTDFLSFYIFDASKTGMFNLQYTDGTIFTLEKPLGLLEFMSKVGQGAGGTPMHLIMAVSTIMVLPIIILFFCAQKTFIEGVQSGGIKG